MGRTLQSEASIGLSEYFNDNYFGFPAMASMCEQIIAVHEMKPSRILEIGKGNGFVSDFLSKAGYQITTFDINPNLKPDVVGSVTELSSHFGQGEFDLVVCAEVLEHIPFELFEPSLCEISKACAGGQALITLPRAQAIWLEIVSDIRLRFVGRKFRPDIFISRKKSQISECHHWEIDHSSKTSLAEIKRLISEQFNICSITRSRHCSYHRFFKLSSRATEA